MDQGTKIPECLTCNHLKRKKIYRVLTIALVVIFLLTAFITYAARRGDGRYMFAISASGLSDGKGNTLDIHGGGVVGMSGWIIFQPGGTVNLKLWGKGGGTIGLTTADGKKYVAGWESIENYGFIDWWILMKIKLSEPINGLPNEIVVEIEEGSKPTLGIVTVSTGPYTHTMEGVVHTGLIYRGEGLVSIH